MDVQDAGIRLAVVSAARLRLAAPPLADPGPVTPGAVVMAAVIGARTQPAAAMLMRAVPPGRSAYELAARHAMVTAMIRRYRQPPDNTADPGTTLLPALRDASPLTGLLDVPGPAGPARCDQVLEQMLGHADGRNLVTLALAAPPVTDEQSSWRGELLNGMLSEDRELGSRCLRDRDELVRGRPSEPRATGVPAAAAIAERGPCGARPPSGGRHWPGWSEDGRICYADVQA